MPPTRTLLAALPLLFVVACGGSPAAPSTTPATPSAEPSPPPAATPVAEASAPAPEAAPAPAPDQTGDEVADASPEPVVMIPAHGPLRLKVKVEPADSLTVEEARDFYLSITVANPSHAPIKLDMTQSVLQVNGKPLKQWKGTTAALPTDGKWRELLPGQSVSFLFKFASKVRVTSGEYGFVLRVDGSNSATVRLQVNP